MEREWITPKDIAATLGVSMHTVYKLVHLKGFPVVKIGKRFLVERKSFITFMNDAKKTGIYF